MLGSVSTLTTAGSPLALDFSEDNHAKMHCEKSTKWLEG